MKLDLRILRFVAGFLIVIAALINLVRSHVWNTDPVVMEKMPLTFLPSADPAASAMGISIGRDVLTLEFPTCDLSNFKDKFFLHVYSQPQSASGDSGFVVQDFDAGALATRRIGTAEEKRCAIDKAYGVSRAKEIVFGQYATPGNHCCVILWSRDFLLKSD